MKIRNNGRAFKDCAKNILLHPSIHAIYSPHTYNCPVAATLRSTLRNLLSNS